MEGQVTDVKIKALEKEIFDIKGIVQDQGKKISILETKTSVMNTEITNIKESLKKIDSNTTWILRIIIGAIVMGLLSFIFKTHLP